MQNCADNENIIEVENLYKSYKDVKAVNGISFCVKKGELFSFLGLNGAGKSTTINILCSILPKDSGRVTIAGLDLDKQKAEIKKKIGIVFQGSVMDKRLTVLENLKTRAALYDLTRAERKNGVDSVIHLLELDDIISRQYEKLSGGQKRRADIARALVHSPELLFLDEPTTGLDPTTRLMAWGTIEGLLEQKGLTVFLTTHYMEEVTKANNVVIIDHGQIITQGSPDELKNKYAKDFLRIIIDKSENIEDMLLEQEKKFSYKNNSYFIEFDTTVEAKKFLDKNGRFTDFEIFKGDMDDVFLNVTGKTLEG